MAKEADIRIKVILTKLRKVVPKEQHKDATEEITAGIDFLIQTVKRYKEVKQVNADRIEEILDVLQSLAKLDYDHKASVTNKGDHYDALAIGVNMLGEELEASTVSLKEKEILLKEIHHRVKNNLQVISSLLNIQSSYIKDEDALDKFKESQNRVISMALIHEKLYQSKDFSQIDFSEYIIELVNSLFYTYNIDPQKIKAEFKVDIEKTDFNIDLALNCGLILNELISNSLKYAFPGDRPGFISVYFKREEETIKGKYYRLVVSDNGIGISKDLDIFNSETLGFQLVTTMVEQLNGKIKKSNDTGTSIEIDFWVK